MIRFDKNLLLKEQHFYLGFSGGVDSLAAAVFLKRGGYNFTLLHIEHFDTEHSARIAEGVRVAAKEIGIGLLVIPVKSSLEPNEANAHKIRSEVFSSQDCKVVLCNHLNDMGESYFMNMCRGHPERVPIYAVNSNIIRPFLATRKKDFEDFGKNNSLEHLIVPDYMKNERYRLRTEVFPVIGQDFTKVCYKLFISSGRIYDTLI